MNALSRLFDLVARTKRPVRANGRRSAVGVSGRVPTVERLESRHLPAMSDLPVLLVIANNDFFYQEYGDTLLSLQEAGLDVVIGAGIVALSTPHPGTGQGASSGQVMPDVALANVSASDYSAIAFAGGYGAGQYEFGFTGNYHNNLYNGTPAIRQEANRLINEFLEQDKYVAAVCNGVSVLAWARVDGESPLDGVLVASATIGAAGMFYNGVNYPGGSVPTLWHSEQNGAVVSPSGSIGQINNPWDDVVVSGRIITGENNFTAREFGRVLAQNLLAYEPTDATPPTATGVYFAGSQWTGGMMNALSAAGVGDASLGCAVANAVAGVGWAGVDRISVRFSETVVADAASLVVTGSTGATVAVTGVAAGPDNTFTWTLAGPLANDRYEVRILSGPAGVRDLADQQLDGEWTTDLPSGNGLAGGDLVFRFDVLPGDGNGDGVVDGVDLANLMQQYGRSGADALTVDFTGNGRVDRMDLRMLQACLGASLPPIPLGNFDGGLPVEESPADDAPASPAGFAGWFAPDPSAVEPAADGDSGMTVSEVWDFASPTAEPGATVEPGSADPLWDRSRRGSSAEWATLVDAVFA